VERLQASDPSQIGPYRLLGRLGEGGMGRVFLGESPGGRKVAIKVVHPQHGDDPEFRRRFQREVAAARQVNVLYTAAVVDANSEGRVPWLATEYVDAPSLADAVRDTGPLPPATLRALAAGLAEALSAIHGADLVHRDLKPSNVLLAADGPRVIDFGIAYAAEASSLTKTNVVVGSPGYMSPEQAEPKRVVGPPSDVFSLGAVLIYAATGHGPWGTGSNASLLYRVVYSEPDIDDVPDEIKSLVTRCMAKRPEDRPTTADIVAELCAPALVTAPLADSGAYRIPRPVQTPMPTPTSAPIQVPVPRQKADRIVTAAHPVAPPVSGTPVLAATPPVASPVHYAPSRPPVQRRRRRWAWLAAAVAAAAVTVPVVIAQAQADPGSKGQSQGHHTTPSPAPALLGVYSGSQYGFASPNSIAADSRHVWVLNGGNDSVTELDARTGAWIRTLSAASYGFKATFNDTAGIVDDGTDVWVGNENSVTEIDSATGALVRTLQIPASVNIHGWYTALVRAGTHLWGVSPDTCRPYCDSASHTGFYASAIEFNASDGSYVRAVSRSNIQTPVALAADGAHVWMIGSDVDGHGAAGTVTELDASDGRQLWSSAVTVYNNPQATTYDSVTYADGFLWVANGESVTELNASTGKLVRVLSGAQYQLNGPAVVAAAGNNVFIVNTNGNSVTEIDARTGALEHTLSAARYHFNGPAGITVAGNHAWILDSAGSVVEIAF
jgi:serine/threonine protein kinase